MTQTFNEDVLIDPSFDNSQLRVQGNSIQTQPLQTWEDSVGNPLAQISSDGRIQIGDLGSSTPDALIEISADMSPSTPHPKRGFNATGRFTDAITNAIAWVANEIELLGSGGISTVQTVLKAKITNNNTGTITDAELRAGDFRAENHQGTSENALKKLTGIRASVKNEAGAHTSKAVAVEASIENGATGEITHASAFEVAPPVNAGTITNLYGVRIPNLTQATNNFAIHTGEGIVHLGDVQEMLLQDTPPANPPAGFISLYPKLLGGVPQLFAKTSDGSEYLVGVGTGHEILIDDVEQTHRRGLNFTSDRGTRWEGSDNADDAVTVISAAAVQTAVFSIDGVLSVEQAPLRLYNKSGSTRIIERVLLGAMAPPAGTAVVVDVNKDGTTIFTNQSHRPQIAPSAFAGETTNIDVNEWDDGEYLTVDVDQVGSALRGGDLSVHVVFA